MNETIESILTFWFGSNHTAQNISKERQELWFGKNDQTDYAIRSRFETVSEAVADSELDHWRESADGLLASIICTDQFPRNMYRDSPKAFAWDLKALGFAEQAVATGQDQALGPVQRVFVYLPYEHSEQIDMQNKAVALFSSLLEQAPDEQMKLFESFLDYARRHQQVIARFGRFPHRNSILDRESSAEELEFLKQPGSSF